MHPALPLLAVCLLPKLAIPEAPPELGGGPSLRHAPSVVLIKSASVRAVQEVADAFSDGCRIHVQQVVIGETPRDVARARDLVQSARVAVVLGQPAVDLTIGTRAHVVSALAPDPPPGAISINTLPPPHILFRALGRMGLKARRIALLTTDRGGTRIALARNAARSLNVELVDVLAHDPREAIRGLRSMVLPQSSTQQRVDAIWLGADPSLIDSQVLRYALELQIEWRVPVLAATRQQVSFGALVAADWPMEVVGRHLARQVNTLLDEPGNIELMMRDSPPGAAEIVVNAQTARRLGIPDEALRGFKVIDR